MTRFSKDDHKIHPTQAVWQVFEIVMNSWLLIVLITKGVTLPLVFWTVAEVGMNSWLLVTLLKVGIRKVKRIEVSLSEIHLRHYQFCDCLGDSGTCCVLACACQEE